MKKITINTLKKQKNHLPITMITAYDGLFAKLFDDYVDMILVGDSLNMSFNLQNDTLSANLDMMIYHTKAVCSGVNRSFVVCDMPFGTYTNKKQAIKNASRVYKETDANAVKIEGGKSRAKIVKALTSNSIAVLGHIGLMPQFARSEGGYIVKGKDEISEKSLIEDAIAIEKAGAFAIVIEGVKDDVAKKITQAIKIPTIGIGAGVEVDGQVLVWSDMLGFFEEFKPKFVKKYIDGAKIIREATEKYINEVKEKEFPTKEFSYG